MISCGGLSRASLFVAAVVLVDVLRRAGRGDSSLGSAGLSFVFVSAGTSVTGVDVAGGTGVTAGVEAAEVEVLAVSTRDFCWLR